MMVLISLMVNLKYKTIKSEKKMNNDRKARPNTCEPLDVYTVSLYYFGVRRGKHYHIIYFYI